MIIHNATVLTATAGYMGIWSCIKLILVFVIILILAYYAARLAGKYQSNTLSGNSNIKIIESYRIGSNKLLAIVKIGENYYAVGIGKEEFTLIDKLDTSYFDSVMEKKENGASFSVPFTKTKQSFREVLSKLRDTDAPETDDDDNKDNNKLG
jgi:flagellar protein FliO/FliZ